MKVAKQAGLSAAHTWMETCSGKPVLVVERYDRTREPDGSLNASTRKT